jgi:hypothetical protein
MPQLWLDKMTKKDKKVEAGDEPTNPVMLEVPKPVKEMTEQEVDAFVEQMVDALLGKC